MPPHDEDCIKIYSNAIFSKHSWVVGLADPHLRVLTKGSVFLLRIITYSVASTFQHRRIRRQCIMKNVFEVLANNLFVRREPKRNLRCNLNFCEVRADIQEEVGCKLKKNESYFSLLIDRCEIFLGEVNFDISSIPIGEFHVFERWFTHCMTEQLREFVKNGDKELVEKLHDHLKDAEYALRYIVKDCINGACMSFICKLRWDNNDTKFALEQYKCEYACFGYSWLDYWYNRKRYFAG